MEKSLSWMARTRGLARTAKGRLPFRRAIRSHLSTKEVWRQIELALTDSRASKIWPNNLETVRSDGLTPHAVLEAKYRFPFGSRTYHYKVVALEPGRALTYAPLRDHVFRGAATIQVRGETHGTTIEWSGEYRFDLPHVLGAVYFQLIYRRRFFSRFEKNLRRWERELLAPGRRQAGTVVNS